MQRVTAKVSTIFIGLGKETFVYRSMAEVPPPLRRRLRENTHNSDTVTIVIADKRGRDELSRVAKRLSSASLACVEPEQKRLPTVRASGRKPARMDLRSWLELLLPIAVGVSLWFFIETRY